MKKSSKAIERKNQKIADQLVGVVLQPQCEAEAITRIRMKDLDQLTVNEAVSAYGACLIMSEMAQRANRVEDASALRRLARSMKPKADLVYVTAPSATSTRRNARYFAKLYKVQMAAADTARRVGI